MTKASEDSDVKREGKSLESKHPGTATAIRDARQIGVQQPERSERREEPTVPAVVVRCISVNATASPTGATQTRTDEEAPYAQRHMRRAIARIEEADEDVTERKHTM